VNGFNVVYQQSIVMYDNRSVRSALTGRDSSRILKHTKVPCRR